MAKSKGVSSKIHTQKQLNDYANQNNPNSKAYRARIANNKKNSKQKNHVDTCCADLEWFCFSNPYDYD